MPLLKDALGRFTRMAAEAPIDPPPAVAAAIAGDDPVLPDDPRTGPCARRGDGRVARSAWRVSRPKVSPAARRRSRRRRGDSTARS